MIESTNTIRKAGGVIVRTNEVGQTELYLIHRSRYDDWSVPKGHIDDGEDTHDAALREILEETGLTCEIVRALPDHVYTMPNGNLSHVAMVECRVLSVGEPLDDEADKGEWCTIAEAVERVTYPTLRRYIQEHYQ